MAAGCCSAKAAVVKRDASTFFDLLEAPKNLQEWFGQPPLIAEELAKAGFSLECVTDACDDLDGDPVDDRTQLFSCSCCVADGICAVVYCGSGPRIPPW